MSLKKMAASTPWRRTGCSVISVTRSGRMHDSSIGMPSRTARYSGSERPAWRMNHTGVRVTDSRRAARTRSLWRVAVGAVVGTGQSCHDGRVAPRHAHPARPEDRTPDSGLPSSGAHANVAGQSRRGLRTDAQRPARRPSALRGAPDRGSGAHRASPRMPQPSPPTSSTSRTPTRTSRPAGSSCCTTLRRPTRGTGSGASSPSPGPSSSPSSPATRCSARSAGPGSPTP